VHLSDVGVIQFGKLEVDDDQTAKTPVEKQQIDAEPALADAQSTLAPNESEVATELQQKILQPVDQRIFEL
jgi:hypothetical protein